MEAAIIGARLKTTLPKALSALGGSRDVRSIQCELRTEDGEAGFLHRSARAAKNTVFTRTWFSLKIRKLKARSEEIHRRLKRYIEEETTVPDGGPASVPASRCGAPAAAAVGMGGPLRELLELVREPGGPSEGKLRVISVVGFHGLGKTLLAHQVFDHGDVRRLFPLRVWVLRGGQGHAGGSQGDA